MNLFVSFDGDSIGRLVGQARLEDNVEEIARISQAIDKGNLFFTSWAIEAGGRTIEAGGDEGLLEIPAVALSGLEAVRQKYLTATGNTVSVGIGRKVSEASKALLAAKLRGKNKSVFYDEKVEEEVKDAPEHTEKEKIGEEYLNKSSVAEIKENIKPDDSPKKKDHSGFEKDFIKIANEHKRRDDAKNAQKSNAFIQLKQNVAQALANLKPQLPVIAQLKDSDPDTYNALMGIMKCIINLGQGIAQAEQDLHKAETLSHINTLPLNDNGLDLGKTDLVPGGDADNMRPEDFDPEALAIGTQHELEHTNDIALAQEIAMDHLAEDPNYYTDPKKDV